MTIQIAILAKQVLDTEIPSDQFKINENGNNLETKGNNSPIINGFDLNATEAALKLRDDGHDVNITVIMAGDGFFLDIIKKPLSMGADNLVLLQDESLVACGSTFTVKALSSVIDKIGPFDIILAGRHASDFDNGHVPIGIAETINLPIITYASEIKINNNHLMVKRITLNGYQIIETSFPCIITVSNEIGEPRYPNLRGIMTATKKTPKIFSLRDLGLDEQKEDLIQLERIFIPENNLNTEFITGEDESEIGRNLAIRLKEEGLI